MRTGTRGVPLVLLHYLGAVSNWDMRGALHILIQRKYIFEVKPLDYVRRDVRGRVVDHARYQFRKNIEPAIAGTSMGAVLLSKTAISALTRTQIQNHREMKVFQINLRGESPR